VKGAIIEHISIWGIKACKTADDTITKIPLIIVIK